jgi:hypothetical protein
MMGDDNKVMCVPCAQRNVQRNAESQHNTNTTQHKLTASQVCKFTTKLTTN